MKIKNKKLPKKQNNYKYYLDIFYLHIRIARSSLVNAIGLGNSLSSFKSLVLQLENEVDNSIYVIWLFCEWKKKNMEINTVTLYNLIKGNCIHYYNTGLFI